MRVDVYVHTFIDLVPTHCREGVVYMYMCVRVCLCICVDVKAYVCKFLAVPRRCGHVSYMCFCVSVCLHAYGCIHTCVYDQSTLDACHTYVYVCAIHICVYLSTVTHIYIYVCTYIHVCVYIHMCTYSHVFVYIYTYICVSIQRYHRVGRVSYIYILCVCHTAAYIQLNADRMAKNLEIIPDTL